MATTFKTLNAKDVISTRNLLHEAIPITGAIVSGTYADENIKNFSHGIFQSVYDYPYLSSSANHIFDLSAGYANASTLSGASNSQNSKKINIYNQMAQVLVGFDENNDIRRFDEDGNLVAGGNKINEAYVINFTRLLTKDEVKKGSFTLELGVSASYSLPFGQRVTLKDNDGITSYKVNSPAGEYGILYAENSAGSPLNGVTASTQQPAGLIYYQAGVAVVTASVFSGLLSSSISSVFSMDSTGNDTVEVLTGSTIKLNCDELRHRIYDMSFNNSVELNSTVYFCRANHNEFNYSANPTYLSASKLVVKNDSADVPVSYATTVGLYSPDNELLAVAKLSEPLKKDPTTEFTVRVRLDY
tara:strand:+ start:45474 stop:46547 length:1074 start_codon:yes stop_codon:yes gene_type:complete